jgi:hypothetical protein
MELVTILRQLWRFRLLVAGAALLATLVALSMTYRIGFPPKLESRQYEVGLGSVTALVDTPSSQVVDLGGKTGANIATLSARASLLASLMTSSPIKDEIARRAGVSVDKLIAAPPSSPAAGAGAPSAVSGASVSAADPKANVLRASIPNLESGDIPIIAVDTQAPDAATAARLANASIVVLQAHLETVAGNDRVPLARRVVVRQLGQARSTTVSRGPGKILAIAAALMVFLLACASIVGVSALIRGWRSAAVMERFGDDEMHGPDDAFEPELFEDGVTRLTRPVGAAGEAQPRVGTWGPRPR